VSNKNGNHRRPLIGITSRRDQTMSPVVLPTFALSQSYVKAVTLSGGAPLMIPLSTSEEALRSIYEGLDGILLSGGGDISPHLYGEDTHQSVWGVDDDRDAVELTLARWALAEGKTLLAICRGVQVMNVAAGGSLHQDILTQVPQAIEHVYYPGYPRNYIAHPVRVERDSLLCRILGQDEVGVNSLHHQSAKNVAPGLVRVAAAPDGVTEGLEKPDHPFAVGVQWHPEELTDHAPMRRLFEAFISEASSQSSVVR
jgi:putative glutamine amidotransferase